MKFDIHSVWKRAVLFGAIVWVGVFFEVEASADAHRSFASAEDGIKALKTATEAKDKAALREIFGPELDQLLTGDQVQDASNFNTFTEAVSERCVTVPNGGPSVTLEIGTNQWPFPIPLVNQGGQWFFDTDAGKEEIINRHIGSDELHAIGVCRAYVEAQRQYASKDRDGSGLKKFALKFKSSPGKKDGLYWPATGNETPAPLDDLVEKAHEEGYGKNRTNAGPHVFHGYLFKVLTGQGRGAPGGKMDYVVQGNLTRGFALIAYPARWGESGVMSFIINQDGKLYQRNRGEKTVAIASATVQYNPTRKWKLVEDSGVLDK